jgi:hypothetical protein
MVERQVSGVMVDVEGKSFVFIHGDNATDPHAHWASEKLLGDFERLGLSQKESRRVIAYAEIYHTFEYCGEDVQVFIELDPGVITITSAHRNLIDDLVEKLRRLGGYHVQCSL